MADFNGPLARSDVHMVDTTIGGEVRLLSGAWVPSPGWIANETHFEDVTVAGWVQIKRIETLTISDSTLGRLIAAGDDRYAAQISVTTSDVGTDPVIWTAGRNDWIGVDAAWLGELAVRTNGGKDVVALDCTCGASAPSALNS